MAKNYSARASVKKKTSPASLGDEVFKATELADETFDVDTEFDPYFGLPSGGVVGLNKTYQINNGFYHGEKRVIDSTRSATNRQRSSDRKQANKFDVGTGELRKGAKPSAPEKPLYEKGERTLTEDYATMEVADEVTGELSRRAIENGYGRNAHVL